MTALPKRLLLTWRKVRALFVNAFAVMTEYQAEILIWIISGSLPLIMMFIWMGLAEDGPVGTYNAADFAAYFLMVFFVRQITMVWVIWDLDREIRLGELSPKLLRPLDPYWQHVMNNLAEKVVRTPIVIITVLAGFWLAQVPVSLNTSVLLAFFLSLTGAWLIRFNRQYSMGLLTFWSDQTTALENVWFTLYIILGGGLAPLDLFPPALQRIVSFTPFPYAIDFPVQVFLGNIQGVDLYRGLLAQATWVLIFIGIRTLLWRQGLKRYGAVGA